MNKQKVILIVAGAVLAALVIGGAVFFAKELGAAKEARELRDAKLQSLRRLYDAPIFPAATNVVTLQGGTGRVTASAASLLAALSAGAIADAGASATPASFKQRLESDVLAMRDQAPIVDGSRIVPERFFFGFDRYLGADGAMPKEEDVARLGRQFATVEILARMVYASRVSEWKSVGREVFEAASEAVAEEEEEEGGGRRRGRGRNRGRGGDDAPAASPSKGLPCDIEGCDAREAYTLEVAGRQLAVIDLLNRISSCPVCMVVSDVSLRRRSPSIRKYVPPETKAAASRSGRSAAPAPAPEPEAPADPEFIPQAERIVSGPELDAMVDARIVVEVYHFPAPEGAGDAASETGASGDAPETSEETPGAPAASGETPAGESEAGDETQPAGESAATETEGE